MRAGIVLSTQLIVLLNVNLWLLTSCVSGVPGSTSHHGSPNEKLYLFSETTKQGSLETSGYPTLIRSRYVTINLDLLDEMDVEDVIVVNVFDDVLFTAIFDRKEVNQSNGYTLFGHIDGVEHSQVTIVVSDGQVAGNVTVPGNLYQIRYAGNKVHAIYSIDQSSYPPEAAPLTPTE